MGVLMLRYVEQRGGKVPEVTLVFWIIKIAATTLGETGGDTVTMTLNWGYLAGTALFLSTSHCARHLADRVEEILSMAVLGDDRCIHHRWYHHGRLCRPLVGSAMPGSFASVACLSARSAPGIGRRLDRSRPSTRRRWKRFTGSPSPSRRRWERRWAIGPQTGPVLAMTAASSSSLPDWWSWPRPTSSRIPRGSYYFGQPSF